MTNVISTPTGVWVKNPGDTQEIVLHTEFIKLINTPWVPETRP